MTLPRVTTTTVLWVTTAAAAIVVGCLLAHRMGTIGTRQSTQPALPAAAMENQATPVAPTTASARHDQVTDQRDHPELTSEQWGVALGQEPRIVQRDGRRQMETFVGTWEDGRRTLLLAEGQVLMLKGKGLDRLKLEEEFVAMLNPGGEVVYLEGKYAGETTLVVQREREGYGLPQAWSIHVVVAPEIKPELVERQVEANYTSLASCFDVADAGDVINVRFLLEEGRVSLVQPGYSDLRSGTESCVFGELRRWTFDGVAGRMTGSYRFEADPVGLLR